LTTKESTQNNFLLLASKIKEANSVAIVGNGGNLAVAKHAASDLSRYLNKFCYAPECVHLTALGGDGGWHDKWISTYGTNADLIIGITTRLNSPISNALEKLDHNKFLIAPKEHPNVPTLTIKGETFHEFEVNTLWEFYMLFQECGAELLKIE
jgi:phosphoheptose isomerase